ncbi:MAG: M12 family metallopeptidase [Bdellovibrionales bacterium]|nr:M12 family metallopeptidase [Bdellovibrionales bacterium]
MKSRWLFLLAVLALAFYWGTRTHSPQEQARPTAEESITTENSALTPAKPQTVTQKPLPTVTARAAANQKFESFPPPPSNQNALPRYAAKPQGMTLEFQVKDGLAIAYGDVVIGKVPEGFSRPAGLTDMPRPNLWNRGPIPFGIEKDVPHPERIVAAIQVYLNHTGVKFVPYTDQTDAIVFTRGKENCASQLGRTGGLQPIYLADNCGTTEIVHELMHALGFVHEQSRIDRDQYVSILWQNIKPEFQSQYAMAPEALMEIYGGSRFDASSVLMYSPHTFSTTPGVDTMKMLDGSPIAPAPRILSDSDIERVNRLYRE